MTDTDWTKPAAYEKPRRRKAKRKANGGWGEAALLLAAFCCGFG